MTEQELIAGAKRELLRNIAIAPVVLFVRLPLGVIALLIEAIELALEWANDRLPGMRRDYAQALRQHRERFGRD